MHWIFYMFFLKFGVETFFFNKVHFSEVMWLLQWVSFSRKDYYVFKDFDFGFEKFVLPVLLVLNKSLK